MLNNTIIIKLLIIFFYIIPGWKILDLMWEAPFHLQGVIIKGRLENNSTKQFLIVIKMRGETKYISAEEKELFPGETGAVIKALFTAPTKDEFVKHLEKLGLNKEMVEFNRIYGNVCYHVGDENGLQLWVHKDLLVPLKVKNKDYEIVFQKYTNFENWLFPSVIEISWMDSSKRGIYIDEISLLKSSN